MKSNLAGQEFSKHENLAEIHKLHTHNYAGHALPEVHCLVKYIILNIYTYTVYVPCCGGCHRNQRMRNQWISGSLFLPTESLDTSSLVPTLCAPPSEKRSGEQSQIFWAYSPKQWKTNEIARSLIIT